MTWSDEAREILGELGISPTEVRDTQLRVRVGQLTLRIEDNRSVALYSEPSMYLISRGDRAKIEAIEDRFAAHGWRVW